MKHRGYVLLPPSRYDPVKTAVGLAVIGVTFGIIFLFGWVMIYFVF